MDGGAIDIAGAEAPEPYPGSETGLAEMVRLAASYRTAAKTLLAAGAGRDLRAPGRLCALHGIELYLNAYLLHHGATHGEIRKLFHDMAKRTQLAQGHGLVLGAKTARHLECLSLNREYLRVRYEPEEQALTRSQVNRLTATLDQVAEAVARALTSKDAAAAA